jgi:hypothetical protein
MVNQHKAIQPGRPRVEVDYALVLRLRDVENLGWSRGAQEYRDRTGQWISKDTFKRRYREAKAMSPLELAIRVMQWKQKMRETAARQR